MAPGTGLLERLRNSVATAVDLSDLATKVRDDLKTGNKAEFAMDLLYLEKIDEFDLPAYIDQGLLWLAAQLKRKEHDLDVKAVPAAGATPGAKP